MELILPLLFAVVITLACSTPKPVALKGAYSTEAKTLETQTSFDEVKTKVFSF